MWGREEGFRGENQDPNSIEEVSQNIEDYQEYDKSQHIWSQVSAAVRTQSNIWGRGTMQRLTGAAERKQHE